ncbi:uncharacterized protein LOC108224611 isoform X3 [Daucus carota subsp. sativus]|uniref:uncharacterized protein LOC108224611 isoform X3 n=1 Tax=Daucus carota subsp. sativus TaxID=79200 RepID=UPI0007F006BC|nr:PREDICTED: GTPase-activating protein GYP7 isoform X2 [Daucus carota subsp. sativus]
MGPTLFSGRRKRRMWRDSGVSTESFYQVRPECTDVPKTKFKIRAGKTLSVRKWHAAFSPEGYLDIGKTLSRIHHGGVHPTIRGEVWEFLLGCYDTTSTFDERQQIRQRRRVRYAQLKDECRQLFPIVGSGRYITAPVITEDGKPIKDPIVLQQTYDRVQENDASNSHEHLLEAVPDGPQDEKVIQWKLTLHQIGMSDLCSPMIILLEDEADAFWCFEHLMRRLRGNFTCTANSVGVETQLSHLAAVTQVIDPKLHQHLENLGGGDYLFAFRMLMVLFRREFSFGDSLYLWEMMWALEYDPDLCSLYAADPEAPTEKLEDAKGKSKSKKQFGKYERENMKSGGKGAETPLPISVFLVASVLKDKSSTLLTEARGLDDVVKILNDLNGNIDAKKACIGALKLHKKYLKKVKKP